MKLKIFSQYGGLRKELYILFIGRIMTNMGSMIFPILTLILSNKLHFSATEIGIFMGIFTLLSLPIYYLGGKMADKFNKKNIIVICDLISVAGFLYCAFVEINFSAILVCSVAALLQQAEGPSYEALVADLTTSKDRSRAYSLSYLGSNLGLVLAPTIAGLLINEHLNLAFLINGLAIISSTILIFFLIKDISKVEDTSVESEYEKEIDSKESTFSYLFKNNVVLIFILLCCFEHCIYSMYYYLMPLDLSSVHGEAGSVIFGTVNSLNCIIVVTCTALITTLSKKIPEAYRMLIGVLLFMGGYILFLLGINEIYMSYISITIFTLGEIIYTITTSPFITRRTPANHRGRISSIITIVSSLSCSLFQILIGNLHDNVGRDMAWIVVLITCLVLLGIIIILSILDKKKYPLLNKVESYSNIEEE